TDSPSAINPAVTPATACSFVPAVLSIWRSIPSARRKHRRAGAAIRVSSWIVCTLEAWALLLDQSVRALDEVGEWEAAFIALAAGAYADCIGSSFLVAHHENEWDLLEREFADFRIHLFVARVEFYTEACGFEPGLYSIRVFEMLL